MVSRARGAMGAFALFVSASVALVGCTGAVPNGSSSAGDGTLTIGTNTLPYSFDAINALDATWNIYEQAVYDTLVRRAPDLTIEPMLATSWEYNADNTQLTMKLRDDVKFTDGVKFDANTAKTELDAFREKGAMQNQLRAVSNVEVVDDYTIRIDLSAPDPSLLTVLGDSAGYMSSPDGIGTDERATNPVGSGPYILNTEKSVAGSSWTFDANPDYWDKSLQKYEHVVIRYFADETAEVNAIKSGQIDVATTVSAPNAVELQRTAGLTLHQAQGDFVGLALFDRGGAMAPPLADLRVRQAINMAFDRSSMASALFSGFAQPTEQIFSTQSDAYDTSLDSTYAFDPDGAKKLLAEAGYPDGFDLSLPSQSSVDPAIYQTVKQSLGDIGIRVSFTDTGTQFLADVLQNPKYPATVTQLNPYLPDWLLIKNYVADTGPWNPLHYMTPELQGLIAAAGAPGSTTEDYRKVNQYLVDNAWFAPWVSIKINTVTREGTDVELQTSQAMPSLYNFSPSE